MDFHDDISPQYFDVARFVDDLSEYLRRQNMSVLSLAMLTDLHAKTIEDIILHRDLSLIKFITMLKLSDFTDMKLQDYIK